MAQNKFRRDGRRKGRSLQRQRSLDVLYEIDFKDLSSRDALDLLKLRQSESTHQVPIGQYGVEIVSHFIENMENIDSMIEAASGAWSIDRMTIVDRNLLRLGAVELMYGGVDRPVVINEVASLAREFSTDKSVSFTMGILNRVSEIWELENSGREEG
ncbi:transcription antitermination factor NusB [Arcanobacterium canis]